MSLKTQWDAARVKHQQEALERKQSLSAQWQAARIKRRQEVLELKQSVAEFLEETRSQQQDVWQEENHKRAAYVSWLKEYVWGVTPTTNQGSAEDKTATTGRGSVGNTTSIPSKGSSRDTASTTDKRSVGNTTSTMGKGAADESTNITDQDSTSDSTSTTGQGSAHSKGVIQPPTLQSVLTFNGTSDYISVPDSESFYLSAYTVETWLKASGIPDEKWKGIIGKPGRNFNIWLHSAGFIHHRFHTTTAWNNGAPDTSNDSVTWDQWTHIAITNDGKTAKTYINGELAAEGELGEDLVADKSTLYIARSLDGSDSTYFKGQLTDIRIWNVARSADEIKQNVSHRLVGNEVGLIAYWPLDEGSGEVATDKTGNNHPGAIHGGVWTA